MGLAEGHGRGVLGWTTCSRLHSTCKVHAAQRTLLCEAAVVGCICAGLRAPCVVTTVQYLPLEVQCSLWPVVWLCCSCRTSCFLLLGRLLVYRVFIHRQYHSACACASRVGVLTRICTKLGACHYEPHRMGCCWGRPYQVPFVTAGDTAADFFLSTAFASLATQCLACTTCSWSHLILDAGCVSVRLCVCLYRTR